MGMMDYWRKHRSLRRSNKVPFDNVMMTPAAESFLDFHFGDGREDEYPLDEIRELNAARNSNRHTPKLSDEYSDD